MVKRTAIGLLMTSIRQCAYGPYPLSRLLCEGSRLLPIDKSRSLKYYCGEFFIDLDNTLPTHQQLLGLEEEK
jgi:hypothetical protein